jgi:hypothetical protein
MPRILHLIDAASRQACPTTLALIALSAGHRPADPPQRRQRVLLLGGARLDDDARSAGLEHAQRIGVPSGRALLGAAALRRAIAGKTYDLIHCWSVGAALVAALLRPRTPRLVSFTQMPHADSLPWLRRAAPLAGGRVGFTVIHDGLRRRLADCGVNVAGVRVVEPGIDPADPGPTPPPRDLRDQWRLADPDDRVLILLSDPPAAADARWANLGLGLVNESLTTVMGRNTRLRLMMTPNQRRRAAGWRMMINYGVADLVGQDPRIAAPWMVLPACQATLFVGPTDPGLAMAWAMAAGRPIVAEDRPGATDWLTSDDNALLAEANQPKRLAHRLHQLLVDTPLADRLGRAAADTARERFDPSGYLARLRDAYAAMLS